MLVLGILFLAIGLYFILSERYTFKRIDSELVLLTKEKEEITEYFKFKILIGVFSIILGLGALINNIIY